VRLLATLILAGTASLGTAFAQDIQTNMSCVERLQMPVYPLLADQARLSGIVTATVLVASDGSIQTKVVGHSILGPAVEKAIRASAFRKTCDRKSVRLVFNFVLGENLDPDHLPRDQSRRSVMRTES
jgi:outer membrane biosynthesis protein TonB